MKKTPLHAVHVAAEASMVEFGGWHMPVQYGPILDEAKKVRNEAGLFDLSHMGRVLIDGPQALELWITHRLMQLDDLCTATLGRPQRGNLSQMAASLGYELDAGFWTLLS